MKPKSNLPETGRATLKDTVVPGLELRGNQKGATWTLRHRVGGKRIRDTIGRWPGLAAPAAREAARVKLSSVAVTRAAGGDVLAQRAERHRLKNARSFGDALSVYVAHRSELRTIGHADKLLRDVFRDLLAEKLPAVSKPDILACVDARRKTAPAVADLSLRYVRPFFKWAYDRGEISADLLTLRVGQTAKRDRFLTREELGKVWLALEHHANHVAAQAVKMMVATAQRRDEVAGMRWSEIEGDLWIIPGERTKTGKDYLVPLNSEALFVLDRARERDCGSDLVFVGATGKTPFSGWSRFKTKLDNVSGVSGWTFHDFRRTFATLSADSGIDPIIADRCLNHVGASTLNDVARRYQHSTMLDQKRDSFERWATIVRTCVDAVEGSNIVKLAGVQ